MVLARPRRDRKIKLKTDLSDIYLEDVNSNVGLTSLVQRDTQWWNSVLKSSVPMNE
jgi:hypothetical protein